MELLNDVWYLGIELSALSAALETSCTPEKTPNSPKLAFPIRVKGVSALPNKFGKVEFILLAGVAV